MRFLLVILIIALRPSLSQGLDISKLRKAYDLVKLFENLSNQTRTAGERIENKDEGHQFIVPISYDLLKKTYLEAELTTEMKGYLLSSIFFLGKDMSIVHTNVSGLYSLLLKEWRLKYLENEEEVLALIDSKDKISEADLQFLEGISGRKRKPTEVDLRTAFDSKFKRPTGAVNHLKDVKTSPDAFLLPQETEAIIKLIETAYSESSLTSASYPFDVDFTLVPLRRELKGFWLYWNIKLSIKVVLKGRFATTEVISTLFDFCFYSGKLYPRHQRDLLESLKSFFNRVRTEGYTLEQKERAATGDAWCAFRMSELGSNQ